MPVKIAAGQQDRPTRPGRGNGQTARVLVSKAGVSNSRLGSRVVASQATTANAKPQRSIATISASSSVEDSAALISSLSSPSNCAPDTVQKLLFLLDVSLSDLSIQLLHSDSQTERVIQEHRSELNIASSSKSTLIAKQAVNAVIASFNNLVTSGWKAQEATASTASPSSRASSASSMRKNVASSTAARPAKEAASILTNNKVLILFDCFRVAVHYLLLARPSTYEIDAILVGVVRKAVTLQLWRAASVELAWLRKERFSASFCRDLAIDVRTLDVQQIDAGLLLDILSLTLACQLAQTSKGDLPDLLEDVTDSSDGPLSSQLQIRSLDSAKTALVDRNAYYIERCIMNCATKESTMLSFCCRIASLKILLTVSDLDLNAFWDRLTRIGVSHFRASQEGSEATHFDQVNALFKDMCIRVKQRHLPEQKTESPTRSTTFTKFCDAWTYMARKVGDVDALRFIASSVQRNEEEEGVDSDQADTHLTRICSQLIVLDAALGDGAAEGIKKHFEDVEGISKAALLVFAKASALQRTRALQESARIRRRCCKILEENGEKMEMSVQRSGVSAMMTSASLNREQCRLPEDPGSGGDEVLDYADDYVRTMRLAAKFLFVLSDQSSHKACNAALQNCNAFLQEIQSTVRPERKVACEWKRNLSISWHYIGAQLYSHKEPALSVPFLEQAARLATESHAEISPTTASLANEYVQQARSLSKRWEHLGMAYRLTSQPRRAEEAYCNAIRYVLPSTWDAIAHKARLETISSIFDGGQKGDVVEECGHLVKLTFDLQIFDLLNVEKGEVTVFQELFHNTSIPRLALGAAVEYGLSALERHSHREERSKAYSLLLEIGEKIYTTQTPLRLARLKMRNLESLVLQGVKYGNDDTQSLLEELRQLTRATDLGEDAQLVRYQKHYRATLWLYEAILTHGSDTTFKQHSDAVHEATEMLKTRDEPSSARQQKITAVSKGTLRQTSAPRQAIDRVPKTPVKKKTRREAESTMLTTSASSEIHDDPERIIQLIEMLVNMDGVAASCSQRHTQLLLAGRGLAQRTQDMDSTVRLTIALAQQHLSVGQTSAALAVCEETFEAIPKSASSIDTYSRFLFTYADTLSRLGDNEKAVDTFHGAVNLAQLLDAKQKNSNGVHSAIQRVLMVERQALAFSIFAQIHFASGRSTKALQASLNGVRAAMRAGLSLTRLASTAIEADELFPFEHVETTVEDESGSIISRQAPRFSCVILSSMYWRSINTLQESYARVSHIYALRGSAKDAEAFAGEAVEFARKTEGRRQALQFALLDRGVLRLRMGQIAKAMDDVEEATAFIETQPNTLLSAVLAYVRGDHQCRMHSYAEAATAFVEGRKLLAELDRSRANFTKEINDRSYTIVPLLKTILLHREAWLMHRMNDDKAFMMLLQEQAESKAEIALVRAMRAVQKALSEIQRDQVLGLMPEAVISLPSAILHTSQRAPVASAEASRAALVHLTEARNHLDVIVESSSALCTSSTILRDARLQRVICTLFANALMSDTETMTRDSLSPINSITLESEFEEAIESKLATASRDTIGKTWPRFINESHTKALPRGNSRRAASPTKGRAMSASEESSESEQDVESRNVWLAAQQRRLQASRVTLPSTWTVVSICLSSDRKCFLIERRSGEEGDPVLLSVPIDRQSRREGEEDALQLDAVLEELRDIVEESNTATHAAHQLDGLEGRKAWWTRRRELDGRLKTLLTAIDSTWLGAFRCILAPPIKTTSAFRQSLGDVLTSACFPLSNSRKQYEMELNGDILDLFSALDMTSCSDEDLEDMIHFAMDAFQLQGAQVAVDEIDMDVCVTDLRTTLDSFQNRRSQCNDSVQDDEHLFLILDKDLSAIPWESMPSLRGRAVCRIPSMAMLQDRLISAPDGRHKIDLTKCKKYFLLNPSQELVRTQDRFAPYFEASKTTTTTTTKWRGIAARAPTMDELGNALESSDLLLYFGHGGAEQYIRPSRLRSMIRCAVTMLWGCSSGALKDMGDFDRTGTAYNYLMAGCPSLVSLLWDATDKELDGVSESVLRLSGAITTPDEEKKKMSIAQAVARSRDACKLPYLTGAACVVYGVPVYLY